MRTVEKTLYIKNKLGLHARAATQLVQLSQSYQSEVLIICGDKKANANSVMALLMLAGATGSEILVRCTGTDAESAMQAVQQLIEAGFNEAD
ncbi:HPr family phosphocarrier protein [Gayadomonas joobiniege]|uniref:HPr family phosphocarrier protein n=1 Tax=Gayadomonas joobiniege TaxID=1234606 RepID=UPI00038294BA|nr:HPr family phosphocarrier protein [Gayadomonas joobiniege]